MKKLIYVTFVLLCSCATTNHKISSDETKKIKSMTVFSSLGPAITVQRISTASQLTGMGGYEKDIDVSNWLPDAELEATIGKSLLASGIKYIKSPVSNLERTELKNNSGKVGSKFGDQAVQIAKKSGAEYALIISPTFTNRRLGSFKGPAESILLSCASSSEDLPKLAIAYRYDVYRLEDKSLIASSPLTVEAKYNGKIKCSEIDKSREADIVEVFKPAFHIAIEAIAWQNIASVGLKKSDAK